MYFTKTPFLAKHFFKDIYWSVPTMEKVIYLTFDDGPTPEITEWTLDMLKKFYAKATFFCIGKNVKKNFALFQKIISENHSIGNHSYSHLNGWKTSDEKYVQDIYKFEQAICHQNPLASKNENGNIRNHGLLFRPPYGKILRSQISILKSRYAIVMWDVMSGDFDQKVSGEKCFSNVINNSRKGSVIVFHDSVKASKNLFYSLPKTLEYFSGKGFRFGQL